MDTVNLNQYENEVTCTYKNERYSVRDNGAIFRHKRKDSRLRPLDEKWTFGRINKERGYMSFSSELVHRIVATAFHGTPPTPQHVVDHKDTNKRNNRLENLHWLTKLENILLNPISRRRVELAYGSVENFLKDPSKPLYHQLDPQYKWMRAVSKEESKNTHKRLLNWAKNGKEPMGGRLGEWLFEPITERVNNYNITDEVINNTSDVIRTNSLTPNVQQENWKTPTEFPLCPSVLSLETYFKNLKPGKVFSRNQYGITTVVEADKLGNYNSLLIVGENPEGVKPWALGKVYIEDNKFVHENLGTFFEENGVLKQYYEKRGLEWTGGDSKDNYM